MMKLVECIPNFSVSRERDEAAFNTLVETAQAVAGCTVLDVQSDGTHNRCVFTLVGSPEGIGEAAFRLAKRAMEVIDMTKHQGAHPRMGATDVIPFVPTMDMTVQECVELSKQVAGRIWDELRIPSFLYEESATAPGRVNLAKIRKGQFEGMPEKLLEPEWAPDFGERKIHPTAGIIAIGARMPLVAFNVWGYRRRARLSLNYLPKTQQLQMGFRKAGSSDIVDVKQCPILVPQLEALLPKVRACLGSLQAMRHLGHVELVQATSGTLMILRHTAPLSSADREKLECFSHSEGLDLYLAPDSEILETVSGEMPWYDSNGLRLTFSPRDFIQVNAGVNQKMVARALEWLDVEPEDCVLDLFCGMGNFTLPLATQAASVV